jgi:hypothetical protein
MRTRDLYFIVLSTVTSCGAADLSSMYDKSTLAYWGQRYQQSTNRILKQVIWPALFAEETRAFGNRPPQIVFPDFGEGEHRQNPLVFYVPSTGDRIVFPVFSMKFLDDLCTAYAWLQVHGYTLETVSEYTAIMMYGKLPPQGIPSPLKALGIPANALSEPEVGQLALGHFVTARTFILLHEMGHMMFRHSASSSSQRIRNEEEADRFAAVVMQRTQLPPLGMLVFFMADALWSAYPQPTTHPLTGARVRALARNVNDRNLAQQLQTFGEKYLDDPDIRAGFVASGKAGDLSTLSPRRPGELPRRPAESNNPSARALFDGAYGGEVVQFLEPKPFPIQLVLVRRDNSVTGHYSFGLGVGLITAGRIEGSRMYFDWEWASNYGRGILESRPDGSFNGTWGYREARSGAGTWTGRRKR